MSKVLNISDESSKLLDHLAQITGQSKKKLLEKALADLAHQISQTKAEAQAQGLKQDKKEWASLVKGRED